MDEIQFLEKEEVNYILEVAEGRDKVVIMLLLDTGCRVGEVVTSRVRDVDWERGYLRLQAKRTKSKRFRTVRMSEPVLRALKDYVGDRGPDEWLFPGRKEHLTTRAVQIALDKVAERAGLQEISPRKELNRRRITPHILRHTHAVRALEIGVPLNDLQEQLGHADLATTSVYTKVTPVHVKEVYDKVNFCGAMGLG